MTKLIASCKRVVQTGPDSWDERTDMLICSDSTTVGQLRAWATKDGSRSVHVHLDDADEQRQENTYVR